jgi:ABC-type thiamine transport system ATPase subunit
VRRLACLVPATAPVYVRYSPLQFVRFAAQVGGRHDVSTADALRALRVAELPDRLIDQPRARLTAVERLSVWLAIYAVRQTSVLLIDDPFVALTPAQAATGARLIREACAPNHVIVVTGRPRDLPRGCADRFLSIETRDLRVLTPSASTVAFVGTAESAQP